MEKILEELLLTMEHQDWQQSTILAEKIFHRDISDKETYYILLSAAIDSGNLDLAHRVQESFLQRFSELAGRDLFYLGRVAYLSHDFTQAEQYFQQALADVRLDGWYRGETESIYARFCRELARPADAVEHYRRAVAYKERERGKLEEYSNMLFNMQYLPLTSQEKLAAAKGYGELLSTVPKYAHIRKRRHAKLRIGYISPDLRYHVVAFFAYAMMHDYDKERFVVYCYTNCIEDKLSCELADMVDSWQNVRGWQYRDIAACIYKDEIDILVDLAGHTANNMLPVLAYKPAPVQITGIGYFATTGLATVDYFLVDKYTATFAEDANFVEKLLRLRNSHFCYTWHEVPQKITSLPFRKKGYVTFGSLNDFSKVSNDVLRAWQRILSLVPESRLYLKSSIFNHSFGRNVAAQKLQAAGIALNRVIMEKHELDYLGAYAEIDIALDTFPYPGGGTTCDALYMGVPVITLTGSSHHSRFGYSLLMNTGIAECCAHSVSEYVDCAVKLAYNPRRLMALRNLLRIKFQRSPVMQSVDYMMELEKKYIEIFQKFLGEENNGQDWFQLGNDYRQRGEFIRAAVWHEQAAILDTAHDAEHYRLAAINAMRGKRWKRALTDITIALNLTGENCVADFLADLAMRQGKCLLNLGKSREAAEAYRRATKLVSKLEEKPKNYSGYLYCLNDADDISIESFVHAHGDFSQYCCVSHRYTHKIAQHNHNKIRVGYISPDFRQHVAFYFYYPLMVAHDQSQYELYAYSLGRGSDKYQQYVCKSIDVFRDMQGKSAAEVAAQIFADEIDVLVDLSGHTTNSGLAVLAYRPAPVQMSGLGYMAATGLSEVDYLFTDRICDPDDLSADFNGLAEKPLYLKHLFCYIGRSDVQRTSGTPAKQSGSVTFGCFNQYHKITDTILKLWREIMEKVPGSHLILKNVSFADVDVRYAAMERLVNLQFPCERICLEEPSANYLSRYMSVDIALDTAPYTGGGTTCEALYMGVPVVTWAAKDGRRGQRYGKSILYAAGLGELVASTTQEYVEKAVALSSNVDLLDVLHKNLRDMLLKSPLMDADSYCQDVENAYQSCFDEWRSSQYGK